MNQSLDDKHLCAPHKLNNKPTFRHSKRSHTIDCSTTNHQLNTLIIEAARSALGGRRECGKYKRPLVSAVSVIATAKNLKPC